MNERLLENRPDLRLLNLFLDMLPITGLAISVFDQVGQQLTIAASDVTAARLEELQFDLGEGPVYEAFHTVTPVLIPDVETDAGDRWPLFIEAVGTVDARAIFAFPLVMGAACIGAATCYRLTPGELDTSAIVTGMSLSRAIAGPAFHRAMRRSGEESRDNAEPSIEMRREVHQATGMVLCQLDTTATDAFSRIRAYAFSTGRTVRDISRDVVSRKLDFGTLPD